MPKIGFCGTMSCGKTTLVNSLRELPEFNDYNFSTERSKYLRDLGIPLNTDSTLKGQTIFLAERCSELIHNNLITDRTIIDVIAFTLNANSISSKEKNKFEKYATQFISEYDYIFYVSKTGINLEDNGVRTLDEDYRNIIDNSIKYLCVKHLNKINNFGIISGSNDDRIEQIKFYLNL